MPRKNPTQPTTDLLIGGLSYQLLFDFEAVAEAEDLTGRPLLTGLHRKDVESPTISLVRAMLFACLHAKQPALTFAEVRALVTRHNITSIWGQVLNAWTSGLAEPDEDEADTDPR